MAVIAAHKNAAGYILFFRGYGPGQQTIIAGCFYFNEKFCGPSVEKRKVEGGVCVWGEV